MLLVHLYFRDLSAASCYNSLVLHSWAFHPYSSCCPMLPPAFLGPVQHLADIAYLFYGSGYSGNFICETRLDCMHFSKAFINHPDPCPIPNKKNTLLCILDSESWSTGCKRNEKENKEIPKIKLFLETQPQSVPPFYPPSHILKYRISIWKFMVWERGWQNFQGTSENGTFQFTQSPSSINPTPKTIRTQWTSAAALQEATILSGISPG